MPGAAFRLAGGASRRTRQRPSPPDIVLCLVDDLGIMDTSLPFLTGNTGPQGPPDWIEVNGLT